MHNRTNINAGLKCKRRQENETNLSKESCRSLYGDAVTIDFLLLAEIGRASCMERVLILV